jgi:RNA polymerase sigma-70 factor (ECF subfamily)
LAELNEAELIELVNTAKTGNREAFHRLYSVFLQRIFNFVLGMVRSREEAEDITQDAFVQAFHKLDGLKEPAKFEHWLYRIARNEIYQRFRRKKGDQVPLSDYDWQELAPAERGQPIHNPEDEFLRQELERVVKVALETLPTKLREVFILSVLHQKSYKEISQIVGRSLLSVKTDIYRARIFSKDSIKRYLGTG